MMSIFSMCFSIFRPEFIFGFVEIEQFANVRMPVAFRIKSIIPEAIEKAKRISITEPLNEFGTSEAVFPIFRVKILKEFRNNLI